jgi:hypothetical protein
LLILCATIFALGQSTDATISGIVVDPSGRFIAGADIEVLNDATGVHYSIKTNEIGIYTVSILPPGQYRLQVSKVGFKTLIKPGVVLNVQSAVALNFTLPVGATSESITVDAGVSTINTTDGSVSTVIDRNFVANMPLNGRSFQNLLTLAPGVSQVPVSAGYGSPAGLSGDIVVNGQRTESNYFTVDGVSANAGALYGGGVSAGVSGSLPVFTALGTTQGLASIDDLQEFRSNTSTYSAEYGRSPGGQFSFSTRSGTNVLHGNLYNYFRNDALDASSWFNDFYGYPKGKEKQNDFGGTIGGPILIPRAYDGRNKTFFFFSYEGLRLASPQASTQVSVPEDALRQQAPVALQPLLNAFPEENDGSDGLSDGFGYYLQSVSYPSRLDNSSIRLDHTIGNKLTVFGRYADTPSNSTTYTSAVEEALQSHTQSATFGLTFALDAHQSNDFRFNFTGNSGHTADTSTNLGGATPFQLNSIPGPNGASFPQDNSNLYVIFLFSGFPSINLEKFPVSQHSFNITDTHNWVAGRHTIKAGLDWRRLDTTLYSENPIEEVAYLNGTQVLQNAPAIAYTETFASSKISTNTPRYQNFSAFLQDEWRVTPHLSLSSGLRWDINPAPTNGKGPVPYTVTQVEDLATTQLAPQGTPLWHTDWLGFAPRIGAAYQIHSASEHNTVLRAGFGVFYDTGNIQGSQGYNGIGFSSSQAVSSASFPFTSAQLTLPPPSATTPYTGTIYGFDPNLRLPYTFQYNFALEQALSKHETLTLGYVGAGARKLLTAFQYSPSDLGNPAFSPSATLYLTQGRATSGYNSLQAKYQRSLYRGLQTLVSYTWSHSIDDASSNLAGFTTLLRARSDFDIRHNLQAAVTYKTPKLESSPMIAALMNDWGLDLRFQCRTALPVNITGNEAFNPGTGMLLQYQPDRVPGQRLYLYDSEYPGGKVINYSAFELTANGVQGDLPRNYVSGFNLIQLDTAITRDIPVRDLFHLQFRAEAFNIFNHPMFGPIYNSLSFYGPSQFGHAYNTANTEGNLNSLYQSGGPRSLQISLKASF